MGSHKQTEKKSKPSYQRTNSQTFKMFDEAQIKEFKEIFGMIDKNNDGMLQTDDLVALYAEDLGKPCDEGALGAMIAEAEVAQMFDQVKPAGGKFNYGKFTRIMKRGS